MVEEALSSLGGRLDIAINNAGINRNSAAEDTAEDEWEATFAVNTKGVFLCCQVSPQSSQVGNPTVFCRGSSCLPKVCITICDSQSLRVTTGHHKDEMKFAVLQAEAKHMLAAGHGKIINTASMASLLVPHPQKQAAYNASKAAGEVRMQQ